MNQIVVFHRDESTYPLEEQLTGYGYEILRAHSKGGIRIVPEADPDLVIVLGGDGTVVWAARSFPNAQIMPFNLGTLGFLAYHNHVDLEFCFEAWRRRQYKISERHMLEIEHDSTYLALNDVVILRNARDPILTFTLEIGNEVITDLKADGLIVATATGSTAYNLGAGGSILHPLLPANIISPLAPHSVGFRSLAVPDDRKIRIQLQEAAGELVVDGQLGGRMAKGEVATITKGPMIQFVRIHDKAMPFLESLKEKLRWTR